MQRNKGFRSEEKDEPTDLIQIYLTCINPSIRNKSQLQPMPEARDEVWVETLWNCNGVVQELLYGGE